MFNVSGPTDIKNRKRRATVSRLLATGLIASSLIAWPTLALAQSPTPAPGSSTAVKPKPKRTLTPGQVAARERQTKCAAEWKAAKAAGKVEKDMKWPKYWSACNKRLKGAT